MYWEEKWGGEGVECKRLETWCDVSFGVETVNYGLSLTPPVLQHSTEWLAHLKTPQVQFYRPMITIAIAFLGFASLRKACNFLSFLGQIKHKLLMLSSENISNIPGCLVLRSRQRLRYISFYPQSHQSLGGNIYLCIFVACIALYTREAKLCLLLSAAPNSDQTSGKLPHLRICKHDQICSTSCPTFDINLNQEM